MGEVLDQTETHTAYVGEREITVIGLKPVFPDEQAEKKNKETIGHSLYSIFEKYSHP